MLGHQGFGRSDFELSDCEDRLTALNEFIIAARFRNSVKGTTACVAGGLITGHAVGTDFVLCNKSASALNDVVESYLDGTFENCKMSTQTTSQTTSPTTTTPSTSQTTSPTTTTPTTSTTATSSLTTTATTSVTTSKTTTAEHGKFVCVSSASAHELAIAFECQSHVDFLQIAFRACGNGSPSPTLSCKEGSEPFTGYNTIRCLNSDAAVLTDALRAFTRNESYPALLCIDGTLHGTDAGACKFMPSFILYCASVKYSGCCVLHVEPVFPIFIYYYS